MIEDLKLDIEPIEGLGTTWLVTAEKRFDEFKENIESDLEEFSLSFKVFPKD